MYVPSCSSMVPVGLAFAFIQPSVCGVRAAAYWKMLFR